MKLIFSIFLLAGTLIFGACVSSHGHFSLIATRPVDLDFLDISSVPAKEFRTESARDQLFSVIQFGELYPTPELAIDKYFNEEKFGNLVLDARVYEISTYAYYLIGHRFVVRGTVLEVPDKKDERERGNGL